MLDALLTPPVDVLPLLEPAPVPTSDVEEKYINACYFKYTHRDTETERERERDQ